MFPRNRPGVLRPPRKRGIAGLCLALLAALALVIVNPSPVSASQGAKPIFQVPFPCGQQWLGQTRSGHQPTASALDMNLANNADAGMPVLAGVYGIATNYSDPSGYGNYVKVAVAGPGGWYTLYAHLSATGLVSDGPVTPQTQIGLVGSTGNSTGEHLHYEQREGTILRGIEFNGSAISYAFDPNNNTYTSANCGGSGVGSATFDGRDYLMSGGAEDSLYPNHYIMSSDGRFVLILQGDGNLVMYGPGYQALWRSGTSATPGRLRMQSDGNLVLLNSGGGAYWSSGSSGGESHLTVQPDGQAVIYTDPGGVSQWTTSTLLGSVVSAEGDDRLTNDQRLYPNKYLKSPDKRYVCVLQSDGNIVVYEPGWRVVWHANRSGNAPRDLLMQASDGNLVAYRTNNTAYWDTATSAGSGSYVRIQNDGNLVVYNQYDVYQWDAL